jgi:hypothetical protein
MPAPRLTLADGESLAPGPGCSTRQCGQTLSTTGLVDDLGCISIGNGPLTRGSSKNLGRVGVRAMTCANARAPATYPPD